MNRVLRKRLIRDLKSNFMRYLALVLLIVMGMYLIISIVAASEIIITGTENKCAENLVEDGEFSVFVPLTELQTEEIVSDGTTLEKKFSMDITMKDGSTIRIMKTREEINLIDLDNGRTAEKYGEAVLEKRYAEVNGYSVGDTITIAGTDFNIVGVGSVPDYDMPIAKFSDVAVESSAFGLAFVTSEQYEDIKANTDQKAEDYTYAYRLGDGMTDEKLKQKIKDFDFDYTQVEDIYFQETIEAAVSRKDDLLDGINDLYNGANELTDGIGRLNENSSELNTAAKELFDGYIAQANIGLVSMGVNETLTADNYAELLDKYIEQTKSEDLKSLKESLDGLKEFTYGISEYTDGVSEAYDGSAELADGVNELKIETDKLIDDFFSIEINNLTSFVEAKNNCRIRAAEGDVVMNKRVGLIAGVIVFILFTYVISVFVIHQIENESGVIGALYALGVKKRDLIVHYLTLPVVITFIGGLIGAFAGFSKIGLDIQLKDSFNYFSLPEFDNIYPLYLIAYSVVMPVLVCVIVNLIVINKRLSQTALSLIRNEHKSSGHRNIKIKSRSFVRLFQIRQMIREARTGLTVMFGMFISMLILMLALNTCMLCSNIKKDNVSDTKYNYMYLYKYPEKNVPEGGEAAYSETLSKTQTGYTLDVTVMGIDGENKYFDAQPEKIKNHIVVSNSVAEHYNVGAGDKLTLTDSASETDYIFTVDGVTQYSVGLTVFMDIDIMRELFGQEDDYYNTVFSDEELYTDEGRLYSVTTRSDIEKSSKVFMELMTPMFTTLIAVSAVIFCVVMYLMLGVMIGRASFGISLVKIFGFRSNEIRRLYLNGNSIIVAVGALICMPLARLLINSIYPTFIANVACEINLHYEWYIYLIVFAAVMLIYFVTNRLLVRKINRITPAEVLKNRE